MSPRSTCIASPTPMLWPRSPTRLAIFCPTMREIAFLTRRRSAVNGVAGAPVPMPATATRSDGASLSMNPSAARTMASDPPKRMFGSSTATTIRRPPVELSLVE